MKNIRILNGKPDGVLVQLDEKTGVTDPKLSGHLLVLALRQFGPALNTCTWLRMAMANIDDPLHGSSDLSWALRYQYERCRHEDTIDALEAWIEAEINKLGKIHEQTEQQQRFIHEFRMAQRAHIVRHVPVPAE